MANLQAYKNLFYRLLPSGDLWPTQDATSANWEKYVRAIVTELQRVDALAESWLDDFFPDASADPGQLEDWERILSLPDPNCDDLDWTALTEAQRRTFILYSLRENPVTATDLETQHSDVTGGSVAGLGPILPVAYAGTLVAGQPLAGPPWAFTYAMNYGSSRVGSDTDFSGWAHTGGFAVYTANDRRSPDGALTADHIDAGSTGGTFGRTITGTSDGDVVRFAVWVYVDEAVDQDAVLRITLRDGTTQDTNFTLPLDRWQRITVTQDLGSGGTTPRVDFVHDANEDMWLWGAYCHIVDYYAECITTRAKPAHVYLEYRCFDDDEPYPLT